MYTVYAVCYKNFEKFQQMPPQPNFYINLPSLEHIITLLKLSADTKNLNLGKKIHSLLVTSKQATPYHVIQTNSLINFYSKCGKIKTARKLFDEMLDRNIVSWSSLMAGYYHNKLPLEAVNLFKYMTLVEDFRPNEYVLATALSSCSDCGVLSEGLQIHGYVLKSGLVFHQYVKNAIVNMYSVCSEMEMAMRVLDSVPGFDCFSYNSIIKGLVENGCSTKALGVLRKMEIECVTWDNVTYVTIFGLCSSLKDLRLGMQIHNRILKINVEFDEFVGSAIIDMYGKFGEISMAKEAFNQIKLRNVVLWTAILAAHLQNGCVEEVLKLFIKMEFEGITPNEYTYAVLLNSCAGLSAIGYGNSVHTRTKKSGFEHHVIVGNALINMYAKVGNIEDANEVFINTAYRDTVTWNAMISGYSHHGLGKEALIVFQDMLISKQFPNYVTFVGVLSACAHMGWVREGFYYFHELMNEFGIKHGLEHYTCIIRLLCRAGLLDQAESFMRSTPVKWDIVAFRTLLNACHVHRNYYLGKRIAEIILHMDPNDVGTYILLSNLHAKAKRWDGVASMRKLMKERFIKKEPGVSWIEIRNRTHVFASDDKKHPEYNEIYKKVKKLLAEIKRLGYVPDVGGVLHDVEDEQKEDYLNFHSEKLAIAYGLMRTPSKAPIRVIKNLRMCDDCHSAVKFISKVTDRVIVVRDVNRFHYFRDGYCTCGDYW